MRIVAWNCCQKFAGNLPRLLALTPDVAVISESQSLPRWPTLSGRALSHLSVNPLPGSGKLLTVLAADPWTVRRHPGADVAPASACPVFVDGPVPFTMIGLWPVQVPGGPRYIAQIAATLDWVDQHHDGGSLVIAGDFNAPLNSTATQRSGRGAC